MSFKNNPYPLIIAPLFKNHLWGNSWPAEYKKESIQENIFNDLVGECWHFSYLEGSDSIVLNEEFKGQSLRRVLNDEHLKKLILGKHDTISILLKTINPKLPLSVQVHPSDNDTMNGKKCFGKEEAWIVLDIMKDIEGEKYIFHGFNNGVTKEDIPNAIKEGTLLKLLNKIHPKRKDSFLITPGTVHALGGGVMILEVQQSSDTTYRLYDYDRKDSSGKKRELHQEEALKVLKVENQKNSNNINSKYFEIKENILNKDNKIHFETNNEFHVVHFPCGNQTRIIQFNDKEMKIVGMKTVLIPGGLISFDILKNSGDSEEFYFISQK